MNKTIVLGVGNILYTDEGIGVFASEYLRANYTFEPEIDIADGATLGFKLMPYFQDYEHVIILDTISIEDKVGSLYRLPAQELLGLGMYRKTAHEVEIVEMLEICSLLEKMAEVTVWGIIPEDIETVNIGLTAPLREAFEGYITHILKELENLKIKPTKINTISLDEIISRY